MGRQCDPSHRIGRDAATAARYAVIYQTLYYLALVLEADGNSVTAEQRVRDVLKLESQNSEANALLGKILVKQNKPAEALKALEVALAKDSTDPEKRYLLARVYQQLGRREDAAREFAAVQKLKAEKLKKDREQTPKP